MVHIMYCKVKDANFYYELQGKGKPIVLLHGFSPDHRVMEGCMEPVFSKQDGYMRLYLDLPGMGKSDAPSWINGTDDMLETVIACIQTIIPEQRFLLAGESYGGYLARGILSRVKERVDGLLLICPLIVADRKLRDCPPKTVCIRDEQFMATLSPADAADFDVMSVIQNEAIYRRYQSEIVQGIRIGNKAFQEKISRNYPYSFNVDDPNTARFDKPCLFLAGRQDATVGYWDLLRIMENYPNATVTVLSNAGHSLHLEQPELFETLVQEWLQRVNEQ
jgi:pimeloyl-ACP methyl ester carboxylesterase